MINKESFSFQEFYHLSKTKKILAAEHPPNAQLLLFFNSTKLVLKNLHPLKKLIQYMVNPVTGIGMGIICLK